MLYHQNVNVWVNSGVAKRLKTWDLSKLKYFIKILGTGEKDPAGHQKGKF